MGSEILLDKSSKQRLIIFRGVSGSGKTSLARDWVSYDMQHRCLVGSNYIGTMLHGVPWTGRPMCEEAITLCKLVDIKVLLSAGFSVVNDDTNIVFTKFNAIRDIGWQLNIETHVIDLRSTPLEQCVLNDTRRRGRTVGRQEIVRQIAVMKYETRFDVE